jgi:multiple sugar transport system substrate-binding protein
VTLEFWTFTDYAAGTPGQLHKTFISEFEKANPNIKVNLVPKLGGDMISGLVTGASAGKLPDVVCLFWSGVPSLIDKKVVRDVTSQWNAMPESYRSQFNSRVVNILQRDGKVWGLPFTGFGTLLWRNRTVLKNSGVDPDAGIKDWNDWLSQIQKVHAKGYYGSEKVLLYDWAQLAYLGCVPGVTYGLSPDGKSVTITADQLGPVYSFMKQAEAYSTPGNLFDQSTQDLFLANKLAFHIAGPQPFATFEQAKQSNGFDYDFMPLPGQTTAKQVGGFFSGEMLFLSSPHNIDAAWKFATFMSDSPQLERLAAGIGRYVANDRALNAPAVKQNQLVQVTATIANQGGFGDFGLAHVPDNVTQSMDVYGEMVSKGTISPQDGAAKAIAGIDQKLQQG